MSTCDADAIPVAHMVSEGQANTTGCRHSTFVLDTPVPNCSRQQCTPVLASVHACICSPASGLNNMAPQNCSAPHWYQQYHCPTMSCLQPTTSKHTLTILSGW
jgi:hypothetical protein